MNLLSNIKSSFEADIKSVLRLGARRKFYKALQFVMTFVSAFLFWKFLIALTGVDSPAVVVLTQSMEPAFSRGDILFTHRSSEIKAGDIVIFQTKANTIPIVHRVVEVRDFGEKGLRYLTKGDNNRVNDRGLYSKELWFLSPEHIQGKIVGYLPYLGYITIVLGSTPTVKMAVFALMGIYYFFSREDD